MLILRSKVYVSRIVGLVGRDLMRGPGLENTDRGHVEFPLEIQHVPE